MRVSGRIRESVILSPVTLSGQQQSRSPVSAVQYECASVKRFAPGFVGVGGCVIDSLAGRYLSASMSVLRCDPDDEPSQYAETTEMTTSTAVTTCRRISLLQPLPHKTLPTVA